MQAAHPEQPKHKDHVQGAASTRALAMLVGLIMCLTAGHVSAEQVSSKSTTDLDFNGTEPTVALVLSGGGALGFTHIGVIQLIEELDIPIDIVVGTSMGAIAGGLFATGYSAQDMAEVVEGIDWVGMFVEAPSRSRFSFREKADSRSYVARIEFQHDGRLVLSPGIVGGQRILNLLALLTVEYADEDDFDALPRRFRAVAADIGTGEQVILDSGSLAAAMRASMAVPGVFEPMELNDRMLVDGGIVNNLPTDIAKSLGADIIIAVDIEPELRPGKELLGVSDVMSQTLALLINRNKEDKYALADIVIAPNLQDYTAASFGNSSELIERGRSAAESHREELEQLATQIRAARGTPPPIERKRLREVMLSGIQVEGAAPQDAQRIRNSLGLEVGSPIRLEKLHSQVTALTDEAAYRSVRYDLRRQDESEAELVVMLEPRRESDYLVQLGFAYESHFTDIDEEQFVVAFNTAATGLTTPRSQLSLTQELGRSQRTLLEFHQPVLGPYYLHALTRFDNLLITQHETGDPNEQYRTTAGSVELRTGLTLLGYANAYLSYSIAGVYSRPRYTKDVIEPSFEGRVAGLTAAFEFDSLDRFPFPNRGAYYTLQISDYAAYLGSELEYRRAGVDYRRFFPITDRNVVSLHLRGDGSFDTRPPIWDSAWLGGREDLFGYDRFERRARQLVLIGGEYRFRVPGLPEPARERIFVKVRANAAARSRGDGYEFLNNLGTANTKNLDILWGTGLGFGVRTPIGAVQVDAALRDGPEFRFYVSVGNHF
ncbi:MAG: patatin-like phospholipase family protein [Spirochaeta sp.]|nr:patatin-like phospholipase family protein [Spirochaeta sp.]